MKPTHALISLLLAGILSSSGQAATDSPNPDIDALFADYGETTPGCALGVMESGEFRYRKAYGMANLEHGVPLGPDSVFRIASTSKQFTATAIALLAQQGKIQLEDPISRYFPEFPAWAEDISVMNLVNHSSGIRDYLQLTWLQGMVNDAAYYTDDYVIELLARQRENNFPAGSEYLYSNSGYLLMAHLVQRASGQSLKEFAEQHLFKPLGMQDTHFHNDHTHIVPRRAAGYAPTDEGFSISMTTLDMIGDGGVYTTINDLLHWERNFVENRLGGGDAFIQQLTTPAAFNDGRPMDYAFGLSVEKWRGIDIVHHGGAFVGYRAMFMRFPTERLAIAVLCNRADGDPGGKAYAIAEILLGERLEPAPASEQATPEFTMGEAALAEYVGDFWNEAEGFAAETALEEGQLWAVHSPDRRNPMRAVAPDRFVMLELPVHVLIVFEREDGRIARLKRFIEGRPRGEFTPFQRRQASASELGDYTGEFHSVELDTTYRIYLDDAKLMLALKGVEPMELTPMFGETFEHPDWGAFEFARGADGSIKGFRLQSGRVRNLAFEKR